MTEGRDTLTETINGFADARGVEEDERWAGVVATRLIMDDVNDELVRDGLQEALSLVQQTQEGPDELFGDPREWADAQVEQWRADGRPVEPLEPTTSWRDVPVVSAVTAVILSALIMLLTVVKGRWQLDYTWGIVLLPIVGGLVTMSALTVHESVLQRARRAVAVPAALGVVAVGVAVLTTIFMVGNDHPITTASVWWQTGLVALWAALAWVLARVVPDRPGARRGPVDDDEWLAQAAGLLRLRSGMPESRVRSILDEARGHAGSTGRPLVEEFGAPSSYVSRFPRDRVAAATRWAWVYTLSMPVAAALAVEGLFTEGMTWRAVSWPFAVLTVVIGLAAMGAWRRVARGRANPGTGQPS